MTTIPSGVTVAFNGGSVDGTIIVSDTSALVMADNSSLTSPVSSNDLNPVVVSQSSVLSIQGNTNLDLIVKGTLIPNNCSVDTLTLGATNVDDEDVVGVVKWTDSSSILTINESINATDSSGNSSDLDESNFDVSETTGYLGVPANTDISDFEKDNLIVVAKGANITAMEAHKSGDSELTVNVTFGTNHQIASSFVIEKQTSGEWVLIEDSATATSTVLATAIPYGQSWIRTFDGESFIYDYVWTVLGTSMDVVSLCIKNDDAVNYFVASKVIAPTSIVRAKQTVTVLARICASSDSANTLLNDWDGNITSVTYTCYKITQNNFGTIRTSVTGHTEVSVSTDCVSDSVATSTLWTGSNLGYNFSLTPSTRTNALFPESGIYEIEITVNWKNSEGTAQTPIVFSNKIEVLL